MTELGIESTSLGSVRIFSQMPISVRSDSCNNLYTMKSSTNVDGLIWPKTIEEIFHHHFHCFSKVAEECIICSLPVCRKEAESKPLISLESCFLRHLESFQSRKVVVSVQWLFPDAPISQSLLSVVITGDNLPVASTVESSLILEWISILPQRPLRYNIH